ncbi:MAG TPA: hypothetical protein DCX53_07290 [Anaerolineae bacterium]|nr:hypothetical protein [Anaerolineae bacterium]
MGRLSALLIKDSAVNDFQDALAEGIENNWVEPAQNIGEYFSALIRMMIPTECIVSPEDIPDLALAGRSLCGEIDPFIPGAFTGTNIDYLQAVQQTAVALQVVDPGNPFSSSLLPLVPIAPVACAVYDCVYDLITGTGEYYDLVTFIP